MAGYYPYQTIEKSNGTWRFEPMFYLSEQWMMDLWRKDFKINEYDSEQLAKAGLDSYLARLVSLRKHPLVPCETARGVGKVRAVISVPFYIQLVFHEVLENHEFRSKSDAERAIVDFEQEYL
jgi:hypothetical protein